MDSPTPHFEYEHRIGRARELARAAGHDGVLVWGRGGGSLDGYADLFYLAGAYVDFPLLYDFGDRWSDRGYGALLLTADAADLYVFPSEAPDPPAAPVEVRPAPSLAVGVGERLRELGLEDGRLALVGGGSLNWHQGERLREAAPNLRLVAGDDLAAKLRVKKSAGELTVMRTGAELARHAVESVLDSATPGQTVDALNADATALVIAAGARVSNLYTDLYPAGGSDAGGVIRSGDLITMDLTGTLDGYFFDVCRTATIGAPHSAGAARLIALAEDTVGAVVRNLVPGRTVGEAAEAGFGELERAGYDWSRDEFQALGHGLGLGFEPPWIHPGDRTELEPGMVFAVERYCSGHGTCGAFENTYVVTTEGARILADLSPDEAATVSGPAHD